MINYTTTLAEQAFEKLIRVTNPQSLTVMKEVLRDYEYELINRLHGLSDSCKTDIKTLAVEKQVTVQDLMQKRSRAYLKLLKSPVFISAFDPEANIGLILQEIYEECCNTITNYNNNRPMQMDQQIREQVFNMLVTNKDNYRVVYDYVDAKKGNIKVSCQKYNSLLQTFDEARKIAGVGCSDFYGEETRQKIIYKPGKVRKIRKQLNDGLIYLHITAQDLLKAIVVEGGCFTSYVLNDKELKLVDLVEKERQRQEAEAARKEAERLDALLKGKPCDELLEFLKENATTTEYVDKSTGLKSFYYTYGTRHYDPDASFIGYAKIIKRGMDI